MEPEFEKRKLGEFVRAPIFVSQEKRMSSLLKEMQAKNTHMAIVVDEFGGVEGCVTMEDLIEEIVGEIYDETDPKKPIFERVDDDTIVTNGDMEIDIINEVFKTSIPQGDNYSTLNGLLHDKIHDLPKEGSSLEIDSLVIKVEKTEKTDQL